MNPHDRIGRPARSTPIFPKRVFGWLTFAGVLLCALPAHATRTYYIDEDTDYSDKSCPAPNKTCGNDCDLNTVTASLQDSLADANWSGNRNVNSHAWPQDFMESCSSQYGTGGVDSSFGDSAALTVFAGHANRGEFGFGIAHDSECAIDFESMRLGAMAGKHAAVGMWLGCRVLRDHATYADNQWLRQQLGFTIDIGIGDDEPAAVFDATSNLTNADAWLNQMVGGLFYDRDPIAITYDDFSLSQCWDAHDSAKLRANVLAYPRTDGPTCGAAEPHFYFCGEHVYG